MEGDLPETPEPVLLEIGRKRIPVWFPDEPERMAVLVRHREEGAYERTFMRK